MRKIRVWVGILISLLFLYLIIRKVDLQQVGTVLSQAEYTFLLPALFFTLLAFLFRSMRWQYILKPLKEFRIQELFEVIMIGAMANHILPARAGEFVRALTLREKMSGAQVFATIIVERVYDTVSLLFVLAGLSLLFPLSPEIRHAGLILGIIFLMIIGCLSLLLYQEVQFLQIVRKALSFFSTNFSEKVTSLMGRFVTGFRILKETKRVLFTFVLSLVIWFITTLVVYSIFWAMNIRAPIYASLVVLVFVSLGYLIPSSPGAIGTYHFFCISALSLFSIEKSQSLGFAVILHASQYIPLTLLGFVFFFKRNLSFKDLKRNEIFHPKVEHHKNHNST